MEAMKQCGWVSVVASCALLAAIAIVTPVQAGEESDNNNLHLAPDIYSEGPHEVELFTVAAENLALSAKGWRKTKEVVKHRRDILFDVKLADRPPRPLLVAAPKTAGEYPIVVIQHGFTCVNAFYSQLMSHIASYGFVVVAPQMYTFTGSDTTGEISSAAAVIDWFSKGLSEALSKRVSSVKPNLEKIALVGHSRGGKVVFGLATGLAETSLNISAVVGLDPVDGFVDSSGKAQLSNPPILQFSQFSLGLSIPTLIIGSGLGCQRKNFLVGPCSPEGVSHQAFFFESAPPSFHFVAPEFGHMDFMDDFCSGLKGFFTYWVCKNGPEREPMRRFSGGIIVAFLQASLLGDGAQFSAALEDPSLAPVKLEKPESFGSLSVNLPARNQSMSSPVMVHVQ